VVAPTLVCGASRVQPKTEAAMETRNTNQIIETQVKTTALARSWGFLFS